MSKRWRRGRWAFLFAAVSGALLLATPLGGGLVRWSYDLFFVVRPDIPIEEVVMVYLDGASLDQLPPLEGRLVEAGARLDRGYHAQVLSNLTAYGARTVVFDVNFSGYQTNASDLALKAAIAAHGQVYLGAWWSERSQPGVSVKSLNIPSELLEGTERWGVTDLNHDSDGTIRRHLHAFAYGTRTPSLSWRVASDLRGEGGLDWEERGEERWVNYYGPEGHFRAISFSEIYLNRSIDPEWFRDKVVFVGAAETAGYAGELREAFPSPYTWYTSRSFPGVDVHATLYMNLMRGDWLGRLPRVVELGVLILFAAGAGLGITPLQPRRALWATLGAGLLAVLVCFGLFCWAGVWFPWLLLVAVQLPVVMIAGLVRPADGIREVGVDPASELTVDFVPPVPVEGRLVIPDHELIRQIGSGGYGDVWLARSVTGALRAVKVIRRQTSGPDRKFEREFEGLKRFEPVSRAHEGLVDILHVGLNPAAGYFYYVMELADDSGGDPEEEPTRDLDTLTAAYLAEEVGEEVNQRVDLDTYAPETLRSRILRTRGLPSVEGSLRLGISLASSLEFLHGKELVHRDIKPTNIIFVGGVPKLADIGLVAARGEARSLVGTAGYIPPEGPGLASADVYSLGMVLYEAATGLTTDRFPNLPPELEGSGARDRFMELYQVILKACEEDVKRRYQRASELAAELRRVAGG